MSTHSMITRSKTARFRADKEQVYLRRRIAYLISKNAQLTFGTREILHNVTEIFQLIGDTIGHPDFLYTSFYRRTIVTVIKKGNEFINLLQHATSPYTGYDARRALQVIRHTTELLNKQLARL